MVCYYFVRIAFYKCEYRTVISKVLFIDRISGAMNPIPNIKPRYSRGNSRVEMINVFFLTLVRYSLFMIIQILFMIVG